MVKTRRQNIRVWAKLLNIDYKEVAKILGLKYSTTKKYLSNKSEIGPTSDHERVMREYVKKHKETIKSE